MPATETNPISANTPNRIILDAGALYLDWDESGEVLLGATRGGSVFTVEKEDRDIEIDGLARGPVIGMKRAVRHTARLEVTLLELTLAELLRLTRGTELSDGTYNIITPSNSLGTSDYLENVAIVASVQNTGTPCVITLLNALESGEWSISTGDVDEGRLSVTFLAHYAAGSNVVPYKIRWPVGAS